jgi:hypothetical protein
MGLETTGKSARGLARRLLPHSAGPRRSGQAFHHVKPARDPIAAPTCVF